jgi:hypothetical protein
LNIFAGFAMLSQALGDEATSKLATPTYSSSARAWVSATIVERPSFSCDRALRAVNVEIAAFPPLADDYLHSVAIPRFGCSYLESMLNVTVEMTPVEAAARQTESAPPFLIVPVNTNSSTSSSTATLSSHPHIIGVIYNFE